MSGNTRRDMFRFSTLVPVATLLLAKDGSEAAVRVDEQEDAEVDDYAHAIDPEVQDDYRKAMHLPFTPVAERVALADRPATRKPDGTLWRNYICLGIHYFGANGEYAFYTDKNTPLYVA